jgi:SSS family solute:Na+ symporter
MRATHNAGVGLLSPQAIGIGTAALVMLAFRVFVPSAPVELASPAKETVS